MTRMGEFITDTAVSRNKQLLKDYLLIYMASDRSLIDATNRVGKSR